MVLCRVGAWTLDPVAGLPHAGRVRGVGQDGDVGQRVAVQGDEIGVVSFGELAAAGRPGTEGERAVGGGCQDRKSTRLNSSHTVISYAVFCLKKKKDETTQSIVDPLGD